MFCWAISAACFVFVYLVLCNICAYLRTKHPLQSVQQLSIVPQSGWNIAVQVRACKEKAFIFLCQTNILSEVTVESYRRRAGLLRIVVWTPQSINSSSCIYHRSLPDPIIQEVCARFKWVFSGCRGNQIKFSLAVAYRNLFNSRAKFPAL